MGEGDIRIQPSQESTKTTRIELAGGSAVLDAVTSELQAFLHRTYDAVPLGAENTDLDFELALHDLLVTTR